MHQLCPPWHPNMQNLGQILIRPAEVGDEHGILQCLAADEAALAKRLQRMHVLVASSVGEIAGTVAASLADGEGHLRGMAVLPECRGNGLAAELLFAIERWLKDHDCRRVTLDTTLPLHAAIRFYEKNGYRRSGRIAEFFGMPLLEYVKELA